MERQIATVDKLGHLVLTADVKSALGIPADSRVEVLVGDQDIRLLVPDPRRISDEEAHRIMDELRGMFVGEPSLEDEYFKNRDQDKW